MLNCEAWKYPHGSPTHVQGNNGFQNGRNHGDTFTIQRPAHRGNTRRKVDFLQDQLTKRDFTVSCNMAASKAGLVKRKFTEPPPGYPRMLGMYSSHHQDGNGFLWILLLCSFFSK